MLVLFQNHLKRTHHIGRAVSRSSAVAARRTALAATVAALDYQARDDPNCSPTGARGPPAGRAGLLLLNRLLRSGVAGPRGRGPLLLGATSGGPRLRPRVGRLAVRGGAFLVSESCVTRCVRARAALRPFVVWRALPLNGRALGVRMLLSGCASGSRQRSVKAQVPAPPGPLNRQSERACSCSDHLPAFLVSYSR